MKDHSPPIIVIGYNRPGSLARLLTSLSHAQYGDHKPDLYICLDKASISACIDLATKYKWMQGEKHIFEQDERLGLFKHIIKAVSQVKALGEVIVLEDDLVVSPVFYDYACQALSHYGADDSIAGISLYSYAFTESRFLPFAPMDDGFDTYFMQVASSWGQAWTAAQWQGFITWMEANPTVEPGENIPQHLLHWGDQSWKKHFNRYLTHTGKYFVHPTVSLSTNFEDEGTHATTPGLFQVAMRQRERAYLFDALATSRNRFDGWFEPEEATLKAWNQSLKNFEFEVDLYGSKRLERVAKPMVLSSRKSSKPRLTWESSMFPIVANITSDHQGGSLHLADPSTMDPAPTDRKTFLRTKAILPKEEHMERCFHVLITADAARQEKLDQTLNDVLFQRYTPMHITVVAPRSDAPILQPKYQRKASLVLSDEQSEDGRLRESLMQLKEGYVLCFEAGDEIKRGALQQVVQLFDAFSDIPWIISTEAEEDGFISLGRRLNGAGAEHALKTTGMPFKWSQVFARVSFLQDTAMQDALAKQDRGRWMAAMMAYALPSLLVMRLVDPVTEAPVINDNHNATENTTHDRRIHKLTSFLEGRTKWPLARILFNAHFGLPDTIRYDAAHETYYRERF